jgi:hypothetical protein
MAPTDSALFLQSFNAYSPAFSGESLRLWQIAGRPQKLHPSLTAREPTHLSHTEAEND